MLQNPSMIYDAGYKDGYREGFLCGVEETDHYDEGFNDGFTEGLAEADALLETEQLVAQERWELVTFDDRGAGHTYRLRVPGGWLYRTTTYAYPEIHALFEEMSEDDQDNAYGSKWFERAIKIAAQSTVFVPDPPGGLPETQQAEFSPSDFKPDPGFFDRDF